MQSSWRKLILLAAATLLANASAAACKSSQKRPATAGAGVVDAGALAAGDAGAGAGAVQRPTSDAWRDDQAGAYLEAPVATGERGMVATESALATRVGVDVLKQGGNGVDAAVAVAFALAVAHPAAGNVGGGGFAVVRLPGGEVVALDFRETAPAAATADMYLSADGKVTDASLTGHRAAGVPGTVAGLWALHQKHGKRPWKTLVAPAIALARDGFEVDAALAESIAEDAERFARFPASAALFLPGGKAPAAGSTWKNPDLAAVLERIAEAGAKGFYEGRTAELVVAEMERGGGLITAADLAGYRAEWRQPVVFDYRGYKGYSMPPPSSGGVILAMVAGMLGGDDLRGMGRHSPQAVHLTAEAWRRAFAARNIFLGDPAFVPGMPLAQLVSAEHAAALRKTIEPGKATPSASTPLLIEGEHTTHFGVVDKDGLAVALTTTLNMSYGSAVVVGGAGFLLNDEMDDFAAKPGAPNAFGLVQGEANKIEPGKRMLSSMSPTIVVDAGGEPVLIAGAQGGSRIPTAVWQVISNVVDHGLDVGQAVGGRRVHHQHLPDVIMVEPGALDRAAWDALIAMGHVLKWSKWPLGVGPAILRRGKQWTGAADPRKPGLALGY